MQAGAGVAGPQGEIGEQAAVVGREDRALLRGAQREQELGRGGLGGGPGGGGQRDRAEGAARDAAQQPDRGQRRDPASHAIGLAFGERPRPVADRRVVVGELRRLRDLLRRAIDGEIVEVIEEDRQHDVARRELREPGAKEDVLVEQAGALAPQVVGSEPPLGAQEMRHRLRLLDAVPVDQRVAEQQQIVRRALGVAEAPRVGRVPPAVAVPGGLGGVSRPHEVHPGDRVADVDAAGEHAVTREDVVGEPGSGERREEAEDEVEQRQPEDDCGEGEQRGAPSRRGHVGEPCGSASGLLAQLEKRLELRNRPQIAIPAGGSFRPDERLESQDADWLAGDLDGLARSAHLRPASHA